MAKLTLNNIASGYATNTATNTNNDAIEAAMENTLSRDGTAPNAMGADLDMNGFSLNNVNNIDTISLTINGSTLSDYLAGTNLEYTTTVTAAGTTTLTVASTYYQDFTGTTTQTVVLPVTSTLALGRAFFIDNDSTDKVTVNSSGGNLVAIFPPGYAGIIVCRAITGTNAASWSVRLPQKIPGHTTTVTAAGTTTLTSTSTYFQDFSGTNTQTVVLPDVTTLSRGTAFFIDNDSTGNVTVNSSGGNLVKVFPPGYAGLVVCRLTTGTTAASWSVRMPQLVPGHTTTVTAAGTTTLTSASTYFQDFSGTTTQTVVLPDVTTLTTGHTFFIDNDSTGDVTVNSSGGNLVKVFPSGFFGTVTCILSSGTTAASWSARMAIPEIAGTFTPGLKDAPTGNAATFTSATGTYVQQGNLIYVTIVLLNITTTGLTAGNQVFITDLPFTGSNITNVRQSIGVAPGVASLSSFTHYISGYIGANVNYISMVDGGSNMLVSQIASGTSDLYLSFSYRKTN